MQQTTANLGQQVKAKHPGTYDDLPDDEVGRRVKAKFPGAYDDFVDFSPSEPQLKAMPSPSNIMRARTLMALPTAGGALGGLAGGALGSAGGPAGMFAGAVRGAGLGGSLGYGLKQLATGQGFSPLEAVKQGSLQGVYEMAGQGAGRLAGKAAAPLLRRSFGVGRALPGATFGDLGESAAREGVGVSPRGIAKADRLREESTSALYGSLNQAKGQGWTAQANDVVKHAQDLLNDPVLPEEDKAKIARQLGAFLKQRGARPATSRPSTLFNNFGQPLPPTITPARAASPIDPVELKGIKQFYQNRANKVYAAKEAGALTLAQENRALFAQKLAQGAQQELERIPGVGTQEARTQSLIGLQRAVEDAYQRPPRAFELHKPGSYPAPFLNSPRALSNYALFANHPAFKAFARQFPRGAAELLDQLQHADQPDQTGATR